MARLVNRLVMFVVLLLVQVLVLNHVWLLNVATPLLYVYFAITFPRNTSLDCSSTSSPTPRAWLQAH